MRTLSLAGPFLVALSVVACSPALEPPAKGSAQYSIDEPAVGKCGVTSVGGIGDGVGNVPELPSGTAPPDEFGVEVHDGQAIEGGTGTYVVRCRIAGESSFEVSVEMEGPNHSLQAGAATETAINVTGTIGANGEGTGSVYYKTTRSGGGENVPTSPCTLSAIPSDGGGFQIDEGEARFTFFCPETTLYLDDFAQCEAKGTIQVRDCIKD